MMTAIKYALCAAILAVALAAPADAKSHFSLARAELAAGHLSQAASELAEAERLSPNMPEYAELRAQLPGPQ